MRQFSFRFWKSTAVVFSLVAVVAAILAATALAGVRQPRLARRRRRPAGISGGRDAGELDAVGGTMTAGAVAVPWTVFEKQTAGEQQIFSRAFAGGAWVTKGHGTVNGASSASPTFLSSLNFDQNKDAEAPSIDFAGAGRTVPWATWYEDDTDPFGHEEIFASRFDPVQDKWVFAGQGRPGDGDPPVLNIRTNKDAENPEVAGGNAAGDTTKPGPWIIWQEIGPSRNQIFVVEADRAGHDRLPGRHQARRRRAGRRLLLAAGRRRALADPNPREPSLNVDPRRAGIEPDIAFTGANDAVPWAVWYEVNDGRFGVNNERVFAAKAVAGATAVRHRRRRLPLGGGRQRHRRRPGARHLRPEQRRTVPATKAAENACTLNSDVDADAEDPKVAAGTMTAGTRRCRGSSGRRTSTASRIFVSRLVGGTHFEVANGGEPISSADGDAANPDITFAKNTPYVSYRQNVGGTREAVRRPLQQPAEPDVPPRHTDRRSRGRPPGRTSRSPSRSPRTARRTRSTATARPARAARWARRSSSGTTAPAARGRSSAAGRTRRATYA